jgi:hypothetical protein
MPSTTVQRNVHGSQDRIEAYHQLRSAIAQVRGKKQLSGKTDIDIEISNQCDRLIANAIIYYNSAILSRATSIKRPKAPRHWLFSKKSPRSLGSISTFTVTIPSAAADIRSISMRWRPTLRCKRVSKGYQQLLIRSDQVQKCHGKLPDGNFGGLGLQPLLGRSILHSGKSTVVYWEEEPDYDVYALLRADILQFVESGGTIL